MPYSNPVTLAALKARMDSELSMLGSFEDTVKTSIIADAVRQFVNKYEPTDIRNTLPVADFAVYVYSNYVDPTKVDAYFDPSPSIVVDGSLVAWHWDFGGGITSDDPYPLRSLLIPDSSYTVTLTITDSLGNSSTVTKNGIAHLLFII